MSIRELVSRWKGGDFFLKEGKISHFARGPAYLQAQSKDDDVTAYVVVLYV